MRVGPGGNLTNFATGAQLPVTLSMSPTGSPDDFGECSEPGLPDGTHLNTPSSDLFHGKVDVGNVNSVIGVRFSSATATLLTFNGLDPSKHYVFRGTSIRRGGYALRWTVSTIMGAQGWVDAHINGTNGGPGVITSNNFPADLVAGQAAYDSGDNKEGVVVGWDFITPAPDGSFSIQSSNYVGHVPGGLLADNTRYGYAISSFMLAEVEAAPPAIVNQPTNQTTVEQNRTFSLNVTATGNPLFYQWYKQGAGNTLVAISGATLPTYSVGQAAVGDSGNYYVVVYNPLSSVTSTVAHVTVNPDVTPPSPGSVYTYPTFDTPSQVATLNQVMVEYNETMIESSINDTFDYTLNPGSISPDTAVVSNNTVILTFTTPLTADSDYSLQINDSQDLAGNHSGALNVPFHSWVQLSGNGLYYEAYHTDPGVTVQIMTNSASFPDNPFLHTNICVLDSRVVYPDDSQHDTPKGSRIRGVFIPPVSGDWVFFLRTFERGNVYLNPNGTDPAGAQLILAEVTGNNPRDWNKFISDTFTLRGGQGYYIETLQQVDAGAGTDVIRVAARLAGSGVPTLGIPDGDLNVDTNSLAGGQVGWPYAPRDVGGPLTLAQDLPDMTVEKTHDVIFTMNISNPSALPVTYSWYRDGNLIQGANGPTYTFVAAQGDNNATFYGQASKIGSLVTTRTAKLTVVNDTHKPTVVAVHASLNGDKVTVTFSEKVGVNADDPFSYTITGASVSSPVVTGSNVVLTVSPSLALGTTYPMSIDFVQDLSGNTMDHADVTIRTWVVGRGFALEELYLNIGNGTAVGDLTANAKFPDSPDVITWATTLEGPTDLADNYGTRLSGWIAPPVGGPYNFYLCSDDNSQLSLSSDDSTANLNIVATESSYNAPRTWTGDRNGGTRGDPPINIASDISLATGQTYAFEVLQKEGTGNDNSGVAWELPTQGTPPANGTPGIPGAYLYSPADPVGSSITITAQPANVPGSSLPTTATFTVAATSIYAGNPNPVTRQSYLWQRDNGSGFTDIVGAYDSSYIVNLTQSDAGARFRALVFSPGASATSQVATVSSTLRLNYSRPGGAVRVSWPAPGTGIKLQRTDTLAGNPPPWADVDPNTYQTDGTSIYVDVSPGFYRLKQ